MFLQKECQLFRLNLFLAREEILSWMVRCPGNRTPEERIGREKANEKLKQLGMGKRKIYSQSATVKFTTP